MLDSAIVALFCSILILLKKMQHLTIIAGCLQGHELTLHVLYRLFSEVEEEHDFLSSTTAASVYEMFLLTVVRIYFPFTISHSCIRYVYSERKKLYSIAG